MSTDTRAALETPENALARALLSFHACMGRWEIDITDQAPPDPWKFATEWLPEIASALARSVPEERGEGVRYEVYRADNGYWYVYGVLSSGAGRDHRCLTDPEARHLTPDAAWRAALAFPPAPVEGERERRRLADDPRLSEEVYRIVLQVRRDDRGPDEATDAILLLVERALASHPVQGAWGGEREELARMFDEYTVFVAGVFRRAAEMATAMLRKEGGDAVALLKDALAEEIRVANEMEERIRRRLASPAPSAPEEEP